MEYAVSILLGIALAASCGFRAFVPLLVANIAALTGLTHFSHGFEWMGSWVSFAIFLTATVFEIAAYYIPWLDHVLDFISKPLAIIAGTLLSASFLGDIDPTVRWVLGIIVGGGTASIVAFGTMAVRATSTATTGGFGNFIVSTIENITSFIMSILSLIIPFIMGIITLFLLVFFGYKITKRYSSNKTRTIGV